MHGRRFRRFVFTIHVQSVTAGQQNVEELGTRYYTTHVEYCEPTLGVVSVDVIFGRHQVDTRIDQYGIERLRVEPRDSCHQLVIRSRGKPAGHFNVIHHQALVSVPLVHRVVDRLGLKSPTNL